MIKVSVIVPVYNVQEYLSKCLESLVNQTLKEIEIIVVNDGTKDNSESIILDFKNRYPEKIIYLKKENGGLSDARNFGTSYAKGEYITYLDGDDYIEKNAYEIMYEHSMDGSKKIIECNFFWTYKDKENEDRVSDYTSLNDYLINGRVVAWNKLYNASWLRSSKVVFPKGLLYEDLEFFFKLVPLLTDIEDVTVVDQPFIHYVQRDNAISYKETAKVSQIVDVYSNVFKYYKEKGFFEKYIFELEYKYSRNLFCSFLQKVLRIKDRAIRHKLLTLFWNDLHVNFPKWKRNKYIYNHLTSVNVYLMCMNSYIYKLFYILK